MHGRLIRKLCRDDRRGAELVLAAVGAMVAVAMVPAPGDVVAAVVVYLVAVVG